MAMTSRERVCAAIRHEQPDRVPIDLGATPSSGISSMAYNRLKAHLGIDPGVGRRSTTMGRDAGRQLWLDCYRR